MIEVGICGASGKMGKRLIGLLETHQFLSLKLGETFTHDLPISLEKLKKIDVLIDFSHPSALSQYAPLLRELRKPAVIGTTGYSEIQKEEIQKLSEVLPVVYSPNMSVGVNILFELVEKASSLFPKDFTPHILELHHSEKKDSPSGTALLLKEKMSSLDQTSSTPIDSVRGGDIVGEHIVSFIGKGERIELIHRAHSRDIFAVGALKAAQWIVHKKQGLYTLKDVIEGDGL